MKKNLELSVICFSLVYNVFFGALCYAIAGIIGALFGMNIILLSFIIGLLSSPSQHSCTAKLNNGGKS